MSLYNKKWNSSSRTPHFLHNLCALGMFLYLPYRKIININIHNSSVDLSLKYYYFKYNTIVITLVSSLLVEHADTGVLLLSSFYIMQVHLFRSFMSFALKRVVTTPA